MDMADTRGHECDDTLSGTLGFEAIGGKRKRKMNLKLMDD